MFTVYESVEGRIRIIMFAQLARTITYLQNCRKLCLLVHCFVEYSIEYLLPLPVCQTALISLRRREISLLLCEGNVLYPIDIVKESAGAKKLLKKFKALEPLAAEDGIELAPGGVIGFGMRREASVKVCGIWMRRICKSELAG